MSQPRDASTAPSFGARLRQARKAVGLSQEELANRSGMSSQAIGALERGERQHPYPATLRHLADALGLAGDARATFLASPTTRPDASRDQPVGAGGAGKPSSPVMAPANAGSPHAQAETPDFPDPPELPIPLTALLGREDDVDRLSTLLRCEDARLLTLVGPGGVGKTRLALHLAQALRPDFPHGVAFVSLAPLADAALVLPTVALTLGLREQGGQALLDGLGRAIGGRRLLLVLDNCEHVLAGMSPLADLLEHCPRLIVLATSRAPLRVRGEHEYPLAPLALPDFAQRVSLQMALRSPAVRLFVERARAASPTFALTPANSSEVAAICGRLDGLPLALELAAPRIRLLTPASLLARLHHRLPLLTGGGRDAPARQQTLQSAIAWSYGLLDEDERTLFRRLSVFAGGCTIDAAEAVCAPTDTSTCAGSGVSDFPDVITELGSLVDKSLVRSEPAPEDEPRFGMLQTIREYAATELEASGDAEETRRRHATYNLSLAAEAAPNLTGSEQVAWLERLERDLDNLRAALGWAREHQQLELGLRLAGALVRFWRERGYGDEGLSWLSGFIARMDAADPTDAAEVPLVVRARAVYAAGWLAGGRGEHSLAVPWLERAVALYHAAGEPIGAIQALSALAGATFDHGDVRSALARYEECIALSRAAHHQGELARALGNLGEMYYHLDDLSHAARYYQESLDVARASGRVEVEAAQLGNLGNVALRQGNLQQAGRLHRQALELKHTLGYRRQIAITLEDLAALAVAEGHMQRAGLLLGAATALRAAIASPAGVPERTASERATAPARAALGEDAWVRALAAGAALPLTQVIAGALER